MAAESLRRCGGTEAMKLGSCSGMRFTRASACSMALVEREAHWLACTFMSQMAAVHFVLLSDKGPLIPSLSMQLSR